MDDDKLKTIITETIKEFFEDNVMTTLLGLLKASEQRIDETNRMIQRMSEISSNYTDVYGKHLSSLELSRDKALDCSARLVSANTELTEQLATARKELDDVRKDYSERLNGTLARNRDLIDKYTKLSESIVKLSGRSSTELRADINVKK